MPRPPAIAVPVLSWLLGAGVGMRRLYIWKMESIGAHCVLVIARVFDALQFEGMTTSTVTDRQAPPAREAGGAC